MEATIWGFGVCLNLESNGKEVGHEMETRIMSGI